MADVPKPPWPPPPALSGTGARPGVATSKPPAIPPPVEARVVWIEELMERGEWNGAAEREWATKWGLSRTRVREHAAEAGRNIRGAMTREAATVRVQSTLEAARKASGFSKSRSRDLVAVAMAEMKLYGLDRPAASGTSVQTTDDPPPEGQNASWWGGGPPASTDKEP